MEMISIEVHLSVEVKDNAMLAHLLFTNNTSNQLYLDRYNICLDGEFRNNVFEIAGGKGEQVSYTGPMIKRNIKPEDFIILENGNKMQITINLNKGYKLIKGKKYIIQYYAFNSSLSEELPLIEMSSNKVTILYQ